jgi:hypothetical protein
MRAPTISDGRIVGGRKSAVEVKADVAESAGVGVE